jgi:hypothetical protein
MGGVSPETCSASCKYEIKFWYTVASCWISSVNYIMMHGYTNIWFIKLQCYLSLYTSNMLLPYGTKTSVDFIFTSKSARYLGDLKFPQQSCRGFWFSGMWACAVALVSPPTFQRDIQQQPRVQCRVSEDTNLINYLPNQKIKIYKKYRLTSLPYRSN